MFGMLSGVWLLSQTLGPRPGGRSFLGNRTHERPNECQALGGNKEASARVGLGWGPAPVSE